MRPPSASPTSGRVVTIMSAAPSSWMRRSSVMISFALAGSSAPVGSSASTTAGRFTMARAMAARCFSPAESSDGKAACLCCRPTSSSA